MNSFSEQNTELVGIDKLIHDDVMLDRQILDRFGLVSVNDDIKRFIIEKHFQRRTSLAISISKKSLEIHGKKDIEPFVSRLAEVEGGVQRYNRRLRDHVNHSVYVYLLGLLLMKETNCIDLVDPLCWKIASLLHDIGYPLQLFSSSIKEYLVLFRNHKLKMSGFQAPLEYSVSLKGLEVLKFSDSDAFTVIENRLGDWGIHQNLRSIWEEQQKQGKLNHGILSALITINLIDSLYEKNNEEHEEHRIIDGVDWGKYCFETQVLPAVAAISLHDILDDVESISLEDSRIAYFLVLSDNLQQWNRYQPGRKACSPSSVNIEFCNSQILCKLTLPKKRMPQVEEAVEKLKSQVWKIQIERVPKPF